MIESQVGKKGAMLNMNETNVLTRYFGVVAQEETYLNLIYLLLAFPLSTVYLVFLVTGLSVGLGTLVVGIGIPILLAVFAAYWGLATFERMLATVLLQEDIPPMSREEETERGAWQRLEAHLANRVTWTSVLYLLLKFLVATIFFVIAVVVVATAVGMLIAPFIYKYMNYPSWWGVWQIDTLGEALILTALALVIVGPISLHITNFLARVSGAMARAMLGRSQS
jgi:hypothetical protein